MGCWSFARLSMKGFSFQLNISAPTEALFLWTKQRAKSKVCLDYWCYYNAEAFEIYLNSALLTSVSSSTHLKQR